MTRKPRRATVPRRFEDLEPRTLLSATGWGGYALNAQHTALSAVASNSLQSILWQTPVDLDPQYSGSDLLIHYGSPVITAANTVIVPVKTGATGGFELQAYSGSTGAIKYTLPTDYALMPSGGVNGYSWTPSYSATLTPGNTLYFAGDGGTVYDTTAPDAAGPSPPKVSQLAFYGLSNYTAKPSAYNSSVYINTPITSDAAGDIFFGFLVIGSTPLSNLTTSGVARIAANGTATFTSVISGMSQVATNSAPALSNDGSTLYVLETTGNTNNGFGSGKLVALNSQTLAVTGQATLLDPLHTSNLAMITNDATASPMVGPDGNVYIGVLENPFASNHDRGWLLQFNSTLTKEFTPGDFGWDDTPSVVPASMVPSYKGTSTYLLMTKYNNYAGEGGNGINKVAILDPNATEIDPSTGATVMKEVLTIAGVTPDPEFPNVPGAVKEWCINTAVVDPATDSVLVTSEDGILYRWNLTTNSFSQQIKLTSGLGEAYTPTLIGPNGAVYAISNAKLFAISGPSLTSASFVGTNTTTQGNWIGVYGSQGYNVIGDPTHYPSYATVTAAGETYQTWVASTTDPRALQNPGGMGRIAASWYASTSFTVDINLTDNQTHDVALYLLDWPEIAGRSEQVQITSATTGTVLDTETVANFGGGDYLQWTLSGHVTITVEGLDFRKALLSGIFFDPVAPPPANTATFIGTNTTTQGNWIGAYGLQGYNVIGDAARYPSYATVTAAGETYQTWVASTTDPRALQNPGGNGRIAASWYASTSFTVDVNLTDGQSHDVALYLLDWPEIAGRSEQVQITDAATNAVLDTETVTNFGGGEYLQWQISGNVVITVEGLAFRKALLSGIFFDPPSVTTAPAATIARNTSTNFSTAAGSRATGVSPGSIQIGTVDFSTTDTTAFSLVADPANPSSTLVHDVAIENLAFDQRRSQSTIE